jgi:hypothetical protein
LFEVYLFGVGVALIVSLLALTAGEPPRLSNYLPFLGGANVVLNHFPANPTTWFVGSYVQIVLLWALFLHRVRITVPLLLLSFAAEVIVRAALIQTAGPFVAYMLLPNWATVFLLGGWHGQRQTVPASFAGPAVALAAAVGGWTIAAQRIPFAGTFPFMHVAGLDVFTGTLFVSVLVSVIYVGLTQLTYRAVSSLPAIWPVQFVARNTLIIFLAHMPIFFALDPILIGWGLSPVERSAIHLAICLPGLAIVSEIVRRTVRPRELRDRLRAGFGPLDRQAGLGAMR